MHADFVPTEHVEPNQYGDDFADFFLRIKNECYELGGVTAPPQLIKTDCDGGYQNGCITAWQRSGNFTSRIMWANFFLPVLLWYEHQMIIGNNIQGDNVAF